MVHPKQIDSAEVVPGDIMVLTHGQNCPDGRLIEAPVCVQTSQHSPVKASGWTNLLILSIPEAPLAERTSMVYASHLSHMEPAWRSLSIPV